MLFNDLKINKISSSQPVIRSLAAENRLSSARSLPNMDGFLQTVKSLEGEVVELLNDGDVIFTTPEGERFKLKAEIDLNLYDKIQLNFNAGSDTPEILKLPSVAILDEISLSEQASNKGIGLDLSASAEEVYLKAGDIFQARLLYISPELLEAGFLSSAQVEQLKKLFPGEAIKIQVLEIYNNTQRHSTDTLEELSFTPVSLLQEFFSSVEGEQAGGFKGSVRYDPVALKQVIDTEFGTFEMEKGLTLPLINFKFSILLANEEKNNPPAEIIENIEYLLNLINDNTKLKKILSGAFLNQQLFFSILKNMGIVSKSEIKDEEIRGSTQLLDEDIKQIINEWDESKSRMATLMPLLREPQHLPWRELLLPIKYKQERNDNKQAFLKQEENGDAHVVTSLELSHLGKIQIKLFLKLRDSVWGLKPLSEQEVNLYINYMKEMPDEVKNEVSLLFMEVLQLMGIKGRIFFKKFAKLPSLGIEEISEDARRQGEEIVI